MGVLFCSKSHECQQASHRNIWWVPQSWALRLMPKPVSKSSFYLERGGWRIKYHHFIPDLVLAACMHNDSSAVRVGNETAVVVESYAKHDSLAYRADWRRGERVDDQRVSSLLLAHFVTGFFCDYFSPLYGSHLCPKATELTNLPFVAISNPFVSFQHCLPKLSLYPSLSNLPTKTKFRRSLETYIRNLRTIFYSSFYINIDITYSKNLRRIFIAHLNITIITFSEMKWRSSFEESHGRRYWNRLSILSFDRRG